MRRRCLRPPAFGSSKSSTPIAANRANRRPSACPKSMKTCCSKGGSWASIFRDALMDYWGGRCPLTGITEPALLRASHIVPWAECDDAQRLDVHNGLLLSALWDAAFDAGLISFADDGT